MFFHVAKADRGEVLCLISDLYFQLLKELVEPGATLIRQTGQMLESTINSLLRMVQVVLPPELYVNTFGAIKAYIFSQYFHRNTVL